MPAQTVVASTPAVPNTRAAPSEPRDAGTADGHFGRQLDAARQCHDQPGKDTDTDAANRAGAKRGADASSANASPADAANEGAAPAPGFGGVLKSVLGGVGEVAGETANQTERAPTDGVPQGVFALFAPLLGSALAAPAAGGVVPGNRTATALIIGGAAGLAANAARASALLKMPDADAQAADGAPAAVVANPIGLAVLLDVVQPRVADDLQPPTTPSAGVGPAPLPPLAATGVGMPVLQLATPAGTPGFGQELGRQITWLATQDIKQARIRLHPEELGQVDLKISVTHGRVDVVFSAQHPGAVQALQQSLPQLDQMLAQQGLSLGHAEVGQHGGDGSSSHQHGAGATAIDDIGELHTVTSAVPPRTLNLLDAFA